MKLIVLFFFCLTFALLHSSHMDAKKKDAEKLAKELKPSIAKIFDQMIDEDEILPDKDKGKQFDPETSDQTTAFEHAIIQSLDVGKKTPPLDESELFLSGSDQITRNPEAYLGIHEKESEPLKKEYLLETCDESIVQTLMIEQIKKVTLTPVETEISFICRGHQETKEFFWESDAKKEQKKWEKELEKDPTLHFWSIDIEGGGLFSNYTLAKTWKHHEHIPCENSQKIEIIQDDQEEVTWETPQKETLELLENNSHCNLVGSSSPFEDKRYLIFRCDKGENSTCKKIRERGGQIIDKVCIEDDTEGECVTYRKTYQIPKNDPIEEPHYTYNSRDIWGLNKFDQTSLVDPDFGEAISKIAAISDIPGQTENHTDLLEAEVFPGAIHTCKKSFSGTILYDCCGDCRGFALDLGLAGCTAEEKELYKKRKAGKCHYIGTQSLKMGLEKESVYVCFPTVLARIIQENGREQLNLSWGNVENPQANGLKIDQIKRVNFDVIDFSDFIVKLRAEIHHEDLVNTLNSAVSSFTEQESKTCTENTLKEQNRLCEGF